MFIKKNIILFFIIIGSFNNVKIVASQENQDQIITVIVNTNIHKSDSKASIATDASWEVISSDSRSSWEIPTKEAVIEITIEILVPKDFFDENDEDDDEDSSSSDDSSDDESSAQSKGEMKNGLLFIETKSGKP